VRGVDDLRADTVEAGCWSPGAIEAVVYELARHNGESPLDRGAALRRRVEALAAESDLARAFELLAGERGWRGEEPGAESAARVASMSRIAVTA
jgi:hypothetical protein